MADAAAAAALALLNLVAVGAAQAALVKSNAAHQLGFADVFVAGADGLGLRAGPSYRLSATFDGTRFVDPIDDDVMSAGGSLTSSVTTNFGNHTFSAHQFGLMPSGLSREIYTAYTVQAPIPATLPLLLFGLGLFSLYVRRDPK